jgi:hypothetical protein
MKKLITAAAAALIFVFVSFSFVACNKDKEISISDIYKNHSDISEFTSYKTEFTLPPGWSVYTSTSSSSDSGYLKEQNAFVIKNDTLENSTPTALSVIKCNDKNVYFSGGIAGMLFSEELAISSLRVSGNLVAAKLSTGETEIYNLSGKTVVSRANFKAAESKSIDKIVKLLDNNLIAVAADYDVNGLDGYTSIYHPTTSGSYLERGSLVCRVKNASGSLDNLNGFDGKYVSVTGNTENSLEVNRMFSVPAAGASVANLTGGTYGTFTEGDNLDDYYCEITYIGNGRFFVHEDWSVTSSDDYTYYDGSDYLKTERHIYDASKDKLTSYNSSYIFISLTNKYYGSDKIGVDTKGFLNDGYMYAAYGITVADNKTGFYDQFILDSDLNIVLSLSSNFGVNLKEVDLEDIGAFDLIIDFVDGKGYVPVQQSSVRMYDYSSGKTIFTNTEVTCSAASFSGGMLVCAEEVDDKTYYGALDLKGNVVIPFEKYTALLSFRGYYTAGVRSDSTLPVLIGKDGKEVDKMTDGTVPFSDIATSTSSTNKYIYKVGCYMYKKTVTDSAGDSVTLYGIKNFNANTSKNIIMEAKMAVGATLYAPATSPEDVFVFEKTTSTSNTVVYTVYRLV